MVEQRSSTGEANTRAKLQALVGTELHVAGFQQARAGRRAALVEDYVELIAQLLEERGVARQVDIAARFGVAQPTVAKMLKRLSAAQLVVQMPHRGITLTEAGHALAARSSARHRLVEDFLLSLGVSAETARCDAEGIEHHVSQETLDALARALHRCRSGMDAA